MGDTRTKSKKETSPEKEELSGDVENISIEEMFEDGVHLFNQGQFIEAIEVFSFHSQTGNILARQYLARCYYRLEKYEAAYKHFQYLSENAEGKTKDYGASMVAAIETYWGNYNKAVKILKSIPATPRNLINLSILYWKKYKVMKDEFSIREATKILTKLDTSTLEQVFIKRINHLKGLIHQAQKDYKLSEGYYTQAFELAEDDVSKGQILNDLASLYIELKNYDHAETTLFQAQKYVLGKSVIEEAFNDKWLGILAIKRKNYEQAKKHLTRAVKTIREKELVREVAGIVFLLAELSRDEGFYKAADQYAEGIALERLLEEVKESDEKIVSFYFDSFFGNSNDNSNPG